MKKSEPTYNGVLGGYGNLSALDIRFSLSFILSLIKDNPKFGRKSVIDCGAGIGRISKELLCQVFKKVRFA
jgi:protein N-terminal methyltransferase